MTTLHLSARPNRFTLLHLYLALAAWCLAGAILFFVTYIGSEKSENRPAIAAATALSAPSGPLAAGVARRGQSCCVEFARHCLPYALPFLLIACLSLVPRPTSISRIPGYTVWAIGLFLW